MTTTELAGPNSTSRMPATLADLTPAWATAALRSTGTIDAATHVTHLSWELLGEGEGFLGDLGRVTFTYEGGSGPATAVLKVPTTKPENRGLALIIGAYENEVRFYNELAQLLDLRLPRRYFAEIEPPARSSAIVKRTLDILPERVTLWLLERLVAAAGKSDQRAVVMMEDLGDARIGDQVAGASTADAERAVEQLARFHAAFWQSPVLDRPWLLHQDDTVLVTHGLYQRAFPVFEQRFREQITPEIRAVLDAVTARGTALLERVGQGPLTLVHGDYRMDNIVFFDGAEPPIGLIDFQAITVGHPLTDLAYYLRPNIDPDRADEIEDTLLHRYHDALVANGVVDYPFDTLQREYELAQLWVLHRGVILIGTLDLSHERGVQIVDRAIERALHVADRLNPDRWF